MSPRFLVPHRENTADPIVSTQVHMAGRTLLQGLQELQREGTPAGEDSLVKTARKLTKVSLRSSRRRHFFAFTYMIDNFHSLWRGLRSSTEPIRSCAKRMHLQTTRSCAQRIRPQPC